MDSILFMCTCLCFLTCAVCFDNDIDIADEFCDIRELITCGNNKGLYSWEFCRARTPNTKRILSVHLDLRYPNRYCRSSDAPKNFGLTEPGDSMWVIKSCFGTFLLCLKVETTTSTNTDIPTTAKVTQPNQVDVYEPNTALVQDPNNVTKSMIELQTSITNNSKQTESSGNIEIIVNENEELDFTTKVLIIAAIATAGLCILCLISTIGCLTMRRDNYGIDQSRRTAIDQEETTVTSLPVSDYQDQEGIYNVIPFDEEGSVFEIEKLSPAPTINNQTEVEVDVDPHIYSTFCRAQDNNINTSSLTLSDENEYDRLRNKPKVSVSDSSTYNRIGDVFRDEVQQTQVIRDVCLNVN